MELYFDFFCLCSALLSYMNESAGPVLHTFDIILHLTFGFCFVFFSFLIRWNPLFAFSCPIFPNFVSNYYCYCFDVNYLCPTFSATKFFLQFRFILIIYRSLMLIKIHDNCMSLYYYDNMVSIVAEILLKSITHTQGKPPHY